MLRSSRLEQHVPLGDVIVEPDLERGEVAPRTFTLRTMPGRIAAVGDLWSDMRSQQQSLRIPMERLGARG